MIQTRGLFIVRKIPEQFPRYLHQKKSSNPSTYCAELVRKYDHENFLCSLLLKDNVRRSALAIRAFNIEIANALRDNKTPALVEGRLQFWSDVLNQIYKENKCPNQPVAREIFRAISDNELPKNYFTRLLSSRRNHISGTTFKDISEMEQYAEDTVSSTYYLILQSAGIKNIHADHAASHLGKAQGLTNLIRAVPHNVEEKVLLLPQDVLVKHGVSNESIHRKINSPEFENVIFDIASRAKSHLDKARSLKGNIPKEAITVFLPAVGVGLRLESLQKFNFNVYNPKLSQRISKLGWKLFWNKILLRF